MGNGRMESKKARHHCVPRILRRSRKAQSVSAFVKVKGHSGDKYNDLADRLAKDALGIQ